MSRQFVTLYAYDDYGRLVFVEHPKGRIWLPHSPLSASESVDDTYEALLKSCSVEGKTPPKLFVRNQALGATTWINYVYKVNINVKLPVLKQNVRFSPVKIVFESAEIRSDEIASETYLTRIVEEVHHSVEPSNQECKKLFQTLGFDETALKALYTALIDEIWPCERYSLETFKSLTRKMYGRELPHCEAIFYRSVCRYEEKYADVDTLPMIVALLEPASENSVIRCRFIFDFYNQGKTDSLTREELSKMLHDIHMVDENVQSFVPDLKTLCKHLKRSESSGMSLEEFSSYLLSKQFPGAESLLRAPRTAQQFFMFEGGPESNASATSSRSVFGDNDDAMSDANAFKLADYAVCLDSEYQIANASPWWEFATEKSCRLKVGPQDRTRFDPKHYPNQMLDMLRYYVASTNGKDPWSIGTKTLSDYYTMMDKICDLVKPIFQKEKRLLQISSPVYTFGDMHGNYKDLLTFEQALWPMGPLLSPCSFVFIGDFVDRGKHGFLLMAHLLSCKVLAPEKFFLVRGNHEDKTVCKDFQQECRDFFKGGKSYDRKIFERIVDVFNHLPLAAVIDSKIFCVHGGFADRLLLPFGIEAINKIKNPLPNPKNDPLAQQLLWNDPRDPHEYEVPDADNLLFLKNKRRKIAKTFSRKALSRFLERNRLSFVIRGHQYIDPGFHVHEDERLLTVFSSSYYCGRQFSRAACALADRGSLRLIRFTTAASDDDPDDWKRNSEESDTINGDCERGS